jgi:hypothetical protein
VPLDPELPAPVPEVPFDLAADARLGVGAEAVPAPGVEAIDGLEQADVADLQQVLGRFGAAQVGTHAGLDQPGIAAHQDLADRLASGAAARQRAQPGQQRVVRQLMQFGVR